MTGPLIEAKSLAVGDVIYVFGLHFSIPYIVSKDVSIASSLATVIQVQRGGPEDDRQWLDVTAKHCYGIMSRLLSPGSNVLLWSKEWPSPRDRPLGWMAKAMADKSTPEVGWTDEAVAQRADRWGQVGEIVYISDSHGLHFLLRFEDGGKACFEPGELDLLPPGCDKSARSR